MANSWRQTDKQYYFPKGVAQLTLPKTNYIALTGIGDPNQPAFSRDIEALYPLAYTLRALLKNVTDPYTWIIHRISKKQRNPTIHTGLRCFGVSPIGCAYMLRLSQRKPSRKRGFTPSQL